MSHHVEEIAHKLAVGGAAVWATLSAWTSDGVSAWIAVLVGGAFYVLGEVRKARKQRIQDDLDSQARRAIHRANLVAIHKGEKPPFPEFLPKAEGEPK